MRLMFQHFTDKRVGKYLTLKHTRITGKRVNAARLRPGTAGAVAIPPPGGSGWYPAYLTLSQCMRKYYEDSKHVDSKLPRLKHSYEE